MDAPWARLQVVAAAFGPGDSLFLLTAARVLFWVHPGERPAGGGGGTLASLDGGEDEVCAFEKFSLKARRAGGGGRGELPGQPTR